MNAYELKQEERRSRLSSYASRLRSEAEAKACESTRRMAAVPFGQPLLVGHHSYRACRRYAERAHGLMSSAISLSERAGDVQARADAVGLAGISSDDPDAIAKLEAKLAGLEAERADKKAESARLRRETGAGLPSYVLSNLGAVIRDTSKRIERLRRFAVMAPRPDIAGTGYVVTEDVPGNRIRFRFSGVPSEPVRSVLKSHGFRWSPTEGAWQTMLLGRGRWNADRVHRLLSESVRAEPAEKSENIVTAGIPII